MPDTIVSLCANVPGVRFMCGTCKFFDDDHCENPDKKLNGRPVERLWCCNEYKHTGMRVIVK